MKGEELGGRDEKYLNNTLPELCIQKAVQNLPQKGCSWVKNGDAKI